MSSKNVNAKIVMVGGGSYNWCPRLINDLIQCPELEKSDVILLDPNLKAAEEVKCAAEKIAANFKREFNFIATSDENSAFKNADFVIITISTGGLEMMRHDLEIPEKYGIYQTVGDSVGPGGWSRTLRNVPVFVNMARKIEKLSPHAVVLNYTNPMASLTGAIVAVSSLRVVGLCHGVFSTYRMLENIFGVEEKDISVNFGGINHFFWILDFKIKGADGYSLLRKKLKNSSLDRILKSDSDNAGFAHSNHALCDELFKEFGHLTYAADRHTCEYFTQYLIKPAMMKRFKLVRTSVEDRYANQEKTRQLTLDLASGTLAPSPRSRETAVDIMKSFVTNTPFVDVVNLPNIGQIDNLPRGAIVETLGFVNSCGFSPIAAGPLPDDLLLITEPHCRIQQMTLDAALNGNKELAFQALLHDPLCAARPPSDIRKMGLELMNATKEWLPQFK